MSGQELPDRTDVAVVGGGYTGVSAARTRALYGASRESLGFVERLIGDEGIDCEFWRCGHVSLASRPSHYRHLAESQELQARVFAHATMLVPAGSVGEAIGSTYYHGGLLDPEAGSLHPAKYFDGRPWFLPLVGTWYRVVDRLS